MTWQVGDVGTQMLVPRGQEFIPPGWLLMDGRCYMKEDFPDLYLIYSFNHAKGDPPNTFRVPNQNPLIRPDAVSQLIIKARAL